MTIKELLEQFRQKNARLSAILAKGDNATVEEVDEAVKLDEELKGLEVKINGAKAAAALAASVKAREDSVLTSVFPNPATDPATTTTVPKGQTRENADFAALIPRGVRVHNLKSAESAYKMGKFLQASIFKDAVAEQWCKEHGIEVKFHRESSNAAGGFLVPEQFENEMIDLREMYGVARRLVKVVPMSSDTRSVPRRRSGLTAYPVGEGVTITESEKQWDRVGLTARKWAVLAKFSNELGEDAIINLGDDFAGEIAYAFSQKEDECLFRGDGTSTYHNIRGTKAKLLALDNNVSNIAGLQIFTGGDWNNIQLSDFHKLIAKAPQYIYVRSTPRWYCSQAFYHGVMERIMLASGGVTAAEIAAGRIEKRFMGYPVEISQVMPSLYAAADIPVHFGALELGAMFGDRRQTTIAMSEHLNFAEDEIAVRGTERFDINVHDVGNADTDPTDRVAGPILGLYTQ